MSSTVTICEQRVFFVSAEHSAVGSRIISIFSIRNLIHIYRDFLIPRGHVCSQSTTWPWQPNMTGTNASNSPAAAATAATAATGASLLLPLPPQLCYHFCCVCFGMQRRDQWNKLENDWVSLRVAPCAVIRDHWLDLDGNYMADVAIVSPSGRQSFRRLFHQIIVTVPSRRPLFTPKADMCSSFNHAWRHINLPPKICPGLNLMYAEKAWSFSIMNMWQWWSADNYHSLINPVWNALSWRRKKTHCQHSLIAFEYYFYGIDYTTKSLFHPKSV